MLMEVPLRNTRVGDCHPKSIFSNTGSNNKRLLREMHRIYASAFLKCLRVALELQSNIQSIEKYFYQYLA